MIASFQFYNRSSLDEDWHLSDESYTFNSIIDLHRYPLAWSCFTHTLTFNSIIDLQDLSRNDKQDQ
mgnify:CR=1 FL=1